MPKRVLVVFGVVLGIGLLLTAGSAWCSDLITEKLANSESIEQTLQQVNKLTEGSPLLTLEEAVSRALKHNPKLVAFSSEVQARGYEVTQVGLFPNPELSMDIENFAGSGAFSGTESAEITALLSQQIELGGKRRQRIAVGELDKKLAEQEYDAARFELISSTRRLFIDVLAAQQRQVLAEEQVDLANKVLTAVIERIASGKAPEIERLRFQSLMLEAEYRKEKAAQELLMARNALAALWDQDMADFEKVQGHFDRPPDVPDYRDLISMLQNSPGFALQQTSADKAEQSVALEEAKRIPDLTLSVGGKSFEETGDNALVAGLAISLPIFDRNQGAVGAAKARHAKARYDLRAKQLQLQSALGNIWQQFQVTHKETTMLRENLLPMLQENFDAIRYGYQAGKFGYLEVLEAEQALFTSRNRYIDSLKNCHQTYVQLEQMLGQKITGNDNETQVSVVQ